MKVEGGVHQEQFYSFILTKKDLFETASADEQLRNEGLFKRTKHGFNIICWRNSPLFLEMGLFSIHTRAVNFLYRSAYSFTTTKQFFHRVPRPFHERYFEKAYQARDELDSVAFPPDRRKLHPLLRSPLTGGTERPVKYPRRHYDVRGPELINHKLIHQQFGIQVLFLYDSNCLRCCMAGHYSCGADVPRQQQFLFVFTVIMLVGLFLSPVSQNIIEKAI